LIDTVVFTILSSSVDMIPIWNTGVRVPLFSVFMRKRMPRTRPSASTCTSRALFSRAVRC
jgi:hypothetical protein